jgi:hypothetical protein
VVQEALVEVCHLQMEALEIPIKVVVAEALEETDRQELVLVVVVDLVLLY